MRRFIVHAGWIFVGSLGIFFLGIVQLATRDVIASNTKIASSVACKLQGFEHVGESVQLNLDCGDKKAFISSPKQVVQYLHNPGSLSCTLHESGRAECTRTTK